MRDPDVYIRNPTQHPSNLQIQQPATTGYVDGVFEELEVCADGAGVDVSGGTIPVASFGVVD